MSKQRILKKLNPLFFKGIAHRGLWNEAFTENGLKAFQNAIDHGLAFEYDIHLTKDGELLVCHDDQLKRTTGKEGIIEELSLQEIRDNYRLLDGEVVPTLQEVLDLNREKVPMVVELKVHDKNYKALAKKARKSLSQIKNPRNVWLISFDPRALYLFGKGRFQRALLVCQDKAWTWKLRHLFESVDLEDVMVGKPQVQAYRKDHPVNVWTIERPEQLEEVLPYVDTVTFQKLDPALITSKLSSK